MWNRAKIRCCLICEAWFSFVEILLLSPRFLLCLLVAEKGQIKHSFTWINNSNDFKLI